MFAVNGKWGEFGNWLKCSVSCGVGEQKRVRVCDSPAPAHGGDDCTVHESSSTETQKCYPTPYNCPSKHFQDNKWLQIYWKKVLGIAITKLTWVINYS